tara:strand:+ start:2504 stop:3214 length:711 start_codon:yes stop_codon:yes gene_type:complete
MEKYFQFQLRPEASSPPVFQLVNMSDVKFLWVKDSTHLFFISNNIDNSAGLVLTGSLENSAEYIKVYLEREWQQLINSNDKIRVIPSILPVTVPVDGGDCALNTWELWELLPTFGEGPEGCATILDVAIAEVSGGEGTITIGSPIAIEGVTGFFAQATDTPCGTQDIAFITGVECGDKGDEVPLPGLENYRFTGTKITCTTEGGDEVNYCLIAKPVAGEATTGTPTITLSIQEVLR